MSSLSSQKAAIIIVDFGSQTTMLIARRVRELGVYSEVVPMKVALERMKNGQTCPKGIILSGGPMSVYEHDAQVLPQALLQSEVPILGICYGMHLLIQAYGGQVQAGISRELGVAQIQKTPQTAQYALLDGLGEGESKNAFGVWMNHADQVQKLPEDLDVIATSQWTPVAAVAHKKRAHFGLHFHPEVTHGEHGAEILARFVHHICGCQPNWSRQLWRQDLIKDVRARVRGDHVILGLSGGVDSCVVAALVHQAIGEQLHCVLVDTGLMRANECAGVVQIFQQKMNMAIELIDASHTFFEALHDVADPETKRRIIGKTFVDVFQQHAQRYPQVQWLAQGTIYPDVIESSGTQGASLIKSHHNVAGLPDSLHLRLLEPLRALFKDEVRALGRELGLPEELVQRHPFPGPGLAVRILGSVSAEKVAVLQKADAILLDELRKHQLYDQVSQAFAVLLPIYSVGISGDKRMYQQVVAIRCVQTDDFMTADWARLNPEFLAKVSSRITNEVEAVGRVVYDISAKPPATVEWE